MKIICKAFISIVSVFALVLGLFGCHSRLSMPSEEEEAVIIDKAEEIIVCLLQAVNNNDYKTFDNMFAQHVLEHSDYEMGRKYTFETYTGIVGSLERINMSIGGSKSSDKSECYDDASLTYRITTDNGDLYSIHFTFYTKHESEKNKIRKFKIFKGVSSEENNFHDVGLRNGVYYPGWVDEIEVNR